MKAREIMTTRIVAVDPERPSADIAKLLLEHRIGAVPVVDRGGAVIGMVSEKDLLLGTKAKLAREIMSTPVVTVSDSADLRVVASLFADHRIGHLPVVEGARLVGIVSRSDLARAVASSGCRPAKAEGPSMLSRAVAELEDRFVRAQAEEQRAATPASAVPPEPPPNAADFRHLVEESEESSVRRRREERRLAAERQRQEVEALLQRPLGEERWREMLERARQAAQRGETETLLMTFPNALCTDGGRAVNVPEPDWPETLRGEPADIYRRWEEELKGQGFRLSARVVSFPDGLPGDIGLFLIWGQ